MVTLYQYLHIYFRDAAVLHTLHRTNRKPNANQSACVYPHVMRVLARDSVAPNLPGPRYARPCVCILPSALR